MSDAAAVVRRYLDVVADLGSPADALLELLHPDVRVTERPNALNPRGTVRDRDAASPGSSPARACWPSRRSTRSS